jgi:hypothetical protein
MKAVRRPAALAVVVLAAVFGAVGGHAGARAASPSRQGWWKVGLPTAGVGIGGLGNLKDPQAADVPDGGMLVQGGQSVGQPAAYAAMAFDLGTAAVAGPVRLVPAPTTASVPGSKLIACPLNDPSFKPADGGAIADAPPYTCSSAVSATVDSSGAYVFDVAGLRRGDSLAVAILPSLPTDRVVFARPSADVLPVNELPAGADGGAASPTPDTGASSIGDGALPLPPTDIGQLGGVASPSVPSLGDQAPAVSAAAATPSALPAAQPATATHPSSTSYTPWVVLALLGLAGVLWIGAGAGEQP